MSLGKKTLSPPKKANQVGLVQFPISKFRRKAFRRHHFDLSFSGDM